MKLGIARSMCTMSEKLGSEIGGPHEHRCGQVFLAATPPPNTFRITTQVKLHSRAEAEILCKSQKKTKAEVQNLARSLRNDWKLGIGTPPAGKKITAG